jgi:hypothetical protein
MALTLGGAASDVINIGSGASLDDLDPFTYLVWLNPTTLTANRVLFRKIQTGVKILQLSNGSGDLQFAVSRSGAATNYTTNSSPLAATGTWIFLAATYNSAASAGQVHNIYKGTLTAAATECTYATATDGSGGSTTDATGDQSIGGRVGASSAFQGAIAVAAIFNRELTLGEILSWQFDPRVMAGCVAFHHFGFNGVSTQPDYSGRGNAGTVTGATVSAHVPLKRPFLRRTNYVPVASGGGGGTIDSKSGASQTVSTGVGVGASVAAGAPSSNSVSMALGAGVAIAAAIGSAAATTPTQGAPAAKRRPRPRDLRSLPAPPSLLAPPSLPAPECRRQRAPLRDQTMSSRKAPDSRARQARDRASVSRSRSAMVDRRRHRVRSVLRWQLPPAPVMPRT